MLNQLAQDSNEHPIRVAGPTVLLNRGRLTFGL